LAKIGRRLVRVVAWATEGIVGLAAQKIAAAWEGLKRPYRLLRMPKDAEDEGFEWGKVLGGRALLLIHGTFSTADAAFSEFVDKAKAELNALYGGRVFAFNHPTLHVSPGENLSWFLAQVPRGKRLEIDVLSHSRGGLVARELAAATPAGTPDGLRTLCGKSLGRHANRGTVLADGKHGMDIVDRYTNLTPELPDGPFTLVMEGVLALVKILYNGSAEGLPGLHCMQPGKPGFAAPLPERRGTTDRFGLPPCRARAAQPCHLCRRRRGSRRRIHRAFRCRGPDARRLRSGCRYRWDSP